MIAREILTSDLEFTIILKMTRQFYTFYKFYPGTNIETVFVCFRWVATTRASTPSQKENVVDDRNIAEVNSNRLETDLDTAIKTRSPETFAKSLVKRRMIDHHQDRPIAPILDRLTTRVNQTLLDAPDPPTNLENSRTTSG